MLLINVLAFKKNPQTIYVVPLHSKELFKSLATNLFRHMHTWENIQIMWKKTGDKNCPGVFNRLYHSVCSESVHSWQPTGF